MVAVVAERLHRRGEDDLEYVALAEAGLGLVAGEVGYNSQPAFSCAFIRKVGVGPSVWLRQQLAG